MNRKSPYLISMISNSNKTCAYKHSNSKNKHLSPISGHEPKYEPLIWNNRSQIKDTHNCYAYALNKIVSNRKNKPQPGYYSNYPPLSSDDYKCNIFYERLKKDIPSLYITNFEGKCKNGFYKAFLALDPKRIDQDYHFYRQDNNGLWSHKPGRLDVTNIDADGKNIINPKNANRNYKYFNYNIPCFFFCLNSKLSKSIST